MNGQWHLAQGTYSFQKMAYMTILMEMGLRVPFGLLKDQYLYLELGNTLLFGKLLYEQVGIGVVASLDCVRGTSTLFGFPVVLTLGLWRLTPLARQLTHRLPTTRVS